MKETYDAIIIGSGIGGLTAAALLQQSGLRTITFEHHKRPGGSASLFRKKGYTFDAGASVFYGFGTAENGGTLNLHRRIFDRLGVEVKTVPDPVQIHYHLPNSFDVKAHYDRERFLGELIARFPDEAQGIRKFYDELEAVYNVLSSFHAGSLENVGHLLGLGIKHPKKVYELAVQTFKSMGRTARKYIQNEELLKFIDIECYSWAVKDAAATPLVNAGICLADRHHGGIHYPIGSSGAIAEALVQGIRKFGGEVRYLSMVDEILMRNSKAIGVRLKSGEAFFAKAIISNATVWDTFNRLVRDRRYRVAESKYEIAPSWFQIFLGVDGRVIPKDFNVHHIIVEDWKTYDQLGGTIYFSSPTVLDPSCAPEGKHVLHVFTTSDISEWDRRLPKDPDYEAAKEARAAELIRRTEKILPGLSEAIELKFIGTPYTNQRYLSRYKGTYGALLREGEIVLQKPQNSTPIHNLYMVGDSCFPGQGVIAVTYSGISCAHYVSNKLGVKFEYV